jgi:uncharacterized protein (TIGR01777 family)
MNIGVTGATGFIGRHLVDFALRRGHEIIAFSRDASARIPGCEMRWFSLNELPDVRGCDAIIHLAGEPIMGLWTAKKKRRIRESRVVGTRRVVEAIESCALPPEVFVSGSGISGYAAGGDAELTENAVTTGSSFLGGVVQEWEGEAQHANRRCRVVFLRTAPVLGKGGGLLGMLLPLFRLGLGAQLGDGRQWMSWIHVVDEARLALFAAENMDVSGPLNACAPAPVRNADFTKMLAATLRRPSFLRVPARILRLAGDLSTELLASKRVVPGAAVDQQFGFHFPDLRTALKDLLG